LHVGVEAVSASRKVVVLVCSVVLLEVIFFTALAPLLPGYAEEFGLGKRGAGVLVAAYAAGGMVGALPAGMLASRFGAKLTILVGLFLIGVTSLGFAFAEHIWLLDAARFGQGVASAYAWTGGLTWVVAVSDPRRRGELIGTVLSGALVGALLGPALGVVASAAGTRETFTGVALVAFALAIAAGVLPGPPPGRRRFLRTLLPALHERQVVNGIWFMLLPGLALGVLGTLAPLSLARHGWGATAVGALFLVAAGLQALVNPVVGRWSDRRGRLAPLRAGLTGAFAITFLLTLFDKPPGLAVLVVAASVSLGFFWTPGAALLSDGANAAQLDQALAFALMNLAWAPGLLVGSAAGGALAEAGGDYVPYAVISGLMLVSLVAFSGGGQWKSSVTPIA
jgi:predicted MFS family arabinose efflux permease